MDCDVSTQLLAQPFSAAPRCEWQARHVKLALKLCLLGDCNCFKESLHAEGQAADAAPRCEWQARHVKLTLKLCLLGDCNCFKEEKMSRTTYTQCNSDFLRRFNSYHCLGEEMHSRICDICCQAGCLARRCCPRKPW